MLLLNLLIQYCKQTIDLYGNINELALTKLYCKHFSITNQMHNCVNIDFSCYVTYYIGLATFIYTVL